MAKSPHAQIADKTIKRVTVKFRGQEYPIVITHNVLIECEELTGLNMLSGAEASMFRPSAKLVRALLYLALKRAGARFTLEQVGENIGPHNIAMLTDAMLSAWAASMPEKEEEENPTEAVPN